MEVVSSDCEIASGSVDLTYEEPRRRPIRSIRSCFWMWPLFCDLLAS